MNPSMDVFLDGEQYALVDEVVPWLIEVLPELEPRYG